MFWCVSSIWNDSILICFSIWSTRFWRNSMALWNARVSKISYLVQVDTPIQVTRCTSRHIMLLFTHIHTDGANMCLNMRLQSQKMCLSQRWLAIHQKFRSGISMVRASVDVKRVNLFVRCCAQCMKRNRKTCWNGHEVVLQRFVCYIFCRIRTKQNLWPSDTECLIIMLSYFCVCAMAFRVQWTVARSHTHKLRSMFFNSIEREPFYLFLLLKRSADWLCRKRAPLLIPRSTRTLLYLSWL